MEDRVIMPIVFSANEKYAPYIAVTICSIIKNAVKSYFYQFYILHTELSENIRLRLEGLTGEYYGVKCVDVTEWCSDHMYTTAYFSKEMYFRLLIPELFTEYDKVLYLDCDTVVMGDISELYLNEFSGELLGGVRNLMHQKMRKYVKLSLELQEENYINSGVLLFNCEQCRNENYTEHAFQVLEKRRDFIYPDQDLINVTCKNRILYLDPKWNFTWHYRHLQLSSNADLHLTDSDMELFLSYEKNPKLIHYTGEIKPWDNASKYLSDIFWQYAKESLFLNLFIKRLVNGEVIKENVQLEKRIENLENMVRQIEKKGEVGNASMEESIELPLEEPRDYLLKYNEVIGSFSYRLGRVMTFPFRKIRDTVLSIRSIGFARTLRLFPDKIRLYKNILIGRK